MSKIFYLGLLTLIFSTTFILASQPLNTRESREHEILKKRYQETLNKIQAVFDKIPKIRIAYSDVIETQFSESLKTGTNKLSGNWNAIFSIAYPLYKDLKNDKDPLVRALANQLQIDIMKAAMRHDEEFKSMNDQLFNNKKSTAP